MTKFTAIYTERVGYPSGNIPKMIRFEQKEGEGILEAMNRAGYDAGNDYDIAEAIVFLFEGHPALEGERRLAQTLNW